VPIGAVRGATPAEFGGSGRGGAVRLAIGDATVVVKTLRRGGLTGRLLGAGLGAWFFGARRVLDAVALAQRLLERGATTARPAFARIRRGALPGLRRPSSRRRRSPARATPPRSSRQVRTRRPPRGARARRRRARAPRGGRAPRRPEPRQPVALRRARLRSTSKRRRCPRRHAGRPRRQPRATAPLGGEAERSAAAFARATSCASSPPTRRGRREATAVASRHRRTAVASARLEALDRRDGATRGGHGPRARCGLFGSCPTTRATGVVLLRLARELHQRALALDEEQVVVHVEPLDQGVDRLEVADATELHRGARLHQRHRVLAQDVEQRRLRVGVAHAHQRLDRVKAHLVARVGERRVERPDHQRRVGFGHDRGERERRVRAHVLGVVRHHQLDEDVARRLGRRDAADREQRVHDELVVARVERREQRRDGARVEDGVVRVAARLVGRRDAGEAERRRRDDLVLGVGAVLELVEDRVEVDVDLPRQRLLMPRCEMSPTSVDVVSRRQVRRFWSSDVNSVPRRRSSRRSGRAVEP
jgi:hypothetical protein